LQLGVWAMSRNASKKKILNKRLLVLSISLSVIIIFGFITYKVVFQNQESKFSLNAAIVDQLSEHYQNSTFITRATTLLTSEGFSVSYFNESIDVPLYKELVEGDYGIIIFRAHSAIRSGETIVDLFTSEEYDGNKYYDYRRDDLLSKAQYLVPLGQETGQFYFAITPNFIERFGHFSKSIIVAMGCSSLRVDCYEMAQSFIDRGATAYIGWNETVLPEDTDQETAKFLEMFISKNKTLSSSVAVTSPHTYHDPYQNITVTTKMDFYPMNIPSVGDLKISDLIAEAKGSGALMISDNSEQFSFMIALFSSKPRYPCILD
jgi:hypothetical protein